MISCFSSDVYRAWKSSLLSLQQEAEQIESQQNTIIILLGSHHLYDIVCIFC